MNADPQAWNPRAADDGIRCRNCGSHVTKRFARVFGDNSDIPHACPECSTNVDLEREASNAGADQ